VQANSLNALAGYPKPRVIDGHSFVFVRGYLFPTDIDHSIQVGTQIVLYRIDLDTGVTRIVSSEHDTDAYDWAIDTNGNVVAQAEYKNNAQHWKLKLLGSGRSDPVIDVSAPIDLPEIAGLAEGGSAVLISMPQVDGTREYQQVSLNDGKIAPWQHGDADFRRVVTGARSDRVEAESRVFDKTDYHFFDSRADVVWRSIKAAFTGATNLDLVDWSDDWNTVVVHVFGPEYGDVYAAVDMTTHNASPIGPGYDGIDAIAPVKWIDYRAVDGRTIHAYLTMPLNREAKNLPLVVLPHGGPYMRDDPGFDWLSQALASRGYVVLQPQFRGSFGFGHDWFAAGFGEVGRKMQSDLSDGVRALAAQGLIDPKRVCIVGHGYGGYAAMAGATLESGVYRCAVSVAGMSNPRADLQDMHWSSNPGARFWDRFLGVSGPDDPKLDAISPIKHVDKVTTPILLIHGHDDTVEEFWQSGDMADALKSARKKVELVELEGEDHWLSKSETRLQMLTAVVRFLEANNPPN
jgi:dipeptidyl aminopeptidase/acylaminoacyl peptidase